MLTPLVLLLIVPGAEPNEAEKLFRQMEAKIMQAKTLECAYENRLEVGGEKVSMKGPLFLGEGNKFRWELTMEMAGEVKKGMLVSDGTKVVTIEDGQRKDSREVPKQLGKVLRTMLPRTGVEPETLVGLIYFPDKDFKVEETFRVSDFKFAKKEMVGKQEAQVVQYVLTVKGEDKPMELAVWIDEKTQLPLKRTITGQKGDKKFIFTETYSKVTLDGKIDPKQFELPKE